MSIPPWPSQPHQFITIFCRSCGYRHEVYQRCSDRLCSDCRQRDYFRLTDGYKGDVMGAERLKLLTLTLKNRPRLAGAVEELRAAWKKLLRRNPYKHLWTGGLYSVECVNKGNGWHVHMHILLDGHFVPQRQLSADWLDITGDSSVCDIRACPSPIKALRYVLKYLTKPVEVAGHGEEYNEVLAGTRLVSAFGSWHGRVTLRKQPFQCPQCGLSVWIIDVDMSGLSGPGGGRGS